MKATEQYFPAVLFIMLDKMVLTYKSVVKLLKCDYSNKLLMLQGTYFLRCCLLYKKDIKPSEEEELSDK